MLAAYHGHAPLVKLLIQHGADPNKINDRGQSPLAGAVFKAEASVIEVPQYLIVYRIHEADYPGVVRGRSRSRPWSTQRNGGGNFI